MTSRGRSLHGPTGMRTQREWRRRLSGRNNKPRFWTIGSLAAVLLLAGVVVVLKADGRETCAVVIAADLSGSAGAQDLVSTRAEIAQKILRQSESCSKAILGGIKGGYGKHFFLVGNLDEESNVFLDEREIKAENMRHMNKSLSHIFSVKKTGGLTSYLTFLFELEDQVSGLNAPVVDVWLLGDGIDTAPPIDLRNMAETDVSQALDRLGPLPDCKLWRIHFVGVNRNASRSVPLRRAEVAEAFWRASSHSVEAP